MTKKIKSTIALVVAAISSVIFFASCEDDSALFDINMDGKSSWKLQTSEHVAISNFTAYGDSLVLQCDHIAKFLFDNEEGLRHYWVKNLMKIGATNVIVNSISEIEGQTFNWENGVFSIGKSIIPFTVLETLVEEFSYQGEIYGRSNLSYCVVTAASIKVNSVSGDVANATLTVTLSCGEKANLNFQLEVTESAQDVITYTYGDAVVIGPHTAKVPKIKYINGIEDSREHLEVEFEASLTAEPKKVTANLDEIAFQSVNPTANLGVFHATYNVVSHELYAQYPTTVSFFDNGENRTVALVGQWSVKFVNKETTDNSSAEEFVYSTVANYNLVVNDNIVTASATQEIEQRDAKNSSTTTVTHNGYTPEGQIRFRIFVDNSREEDVEIFVTAPNGISVTTEAEKVVDTDLFSLTQTGQIPGSWVVAGNAASGSVQYTSYTRVDTYVYNNGLVSTQTTYTKNDNFIVVYEGVEYPVQVAEPTITAGAPLGGAEAMNGNIATKTFSIEHKISRGTTATANQSIRLEKELSYTIPGYHIVRADMTHIYNDNHFAPYRTVICALFQEINGSNTIYVEYNEQGIELSRYNNVPNIGTNDILSMVFDGSGFIPARLLGVSSPQDQVTNWMYQCFSNAGICQGISSVDVTVGSLQNPFRVRGAKNAFGEIIFSGIITLR